MNWRQTFTDVWEWLTTSRYSRTLEDLLEHERTVSEDLLLRERTEVDRLRAENRALLNSMLVRGGFAAIETGEPAPMPTYRHRLSSQQRQRKFQNAVVRGMSIREKALAHIAEDSSGLTGPAPYGQSGEETGRAEAD